MTEEDKKRKPEKNVDRRVIKTRKAIEDALSRLLLNTEYSKITVSAIAREANINRKTFYLHFSSVDDIFDTMTLNHAEKTRERIEKIGLFEKLPLDVDAIAKELGNMYRGARLFNPVFVSKYPVARVTAIFQPMWEDIINKERKLHGLKPLKNANYYAHYILSGVFHTYEYWYNSGDDTPFDEIAQVVAKAMAQGLNGALEE